MKQKKSLFRRLLPWIILAVVLLALVLFAFGPIYGFDLFGIYKSGKEASVGEAPVIIRYEGEKQQLVMENDELLFEMDSATTQFSVTVKATGKTWYSNPADWARDPIPQDTKKNFLASTLTVISTGTGGEPEYDNYTYSILNQNYELAQREDGSIRVDYAIGEIEKIYLIPTAITVERYTQFYNAMPKSNQKMVSSCYTLSKPEELDKKDNKEEILTRYPSAAEQPLYILKDVSATNKGKLENYFRDAGYTEEDFENDQLLVAVSRSNNGTVFNASMIYRLEGGDLVVEVPYDSLRCSTENRMTYISVLPMFGAAGKDRDGFILIPEGGGALINYNNGRLSQNPYYANLYGWDYATERKEAVSETRNAFPVFGMGQEDGSFICIIEGASSFCGINADIAGRFNSYNFVYGKYNVLHFDRFNVSNRTAQLLYMYENEIPDETLIQRYRFMAGDSYVDMAQAYGDYLRGQPDMRGDGVYDDMPVNVELIGAINKVQIKAGFPVDSVVPTTSFADASRIIDELTDSGVGSLNVRMTGWCNGGVRQRVLTSVHVLGNLGGDGGMKQLIRHAGEKDVRLYFDGINCFAYDSGAFNGFLPFSHAARFTTREQVKLYAYDIVTYQQSDWMDAYYLTRPDYAKQNASNLINDLKNRGAAGVAFRDIGMLLNADYYNLATYTREQVKRMNVETLKEANEANLLVSIKEGNDYAVPYADLITDMNLTGNAYAIIDRRIPFYQIALHGLKNYTGAAINLAGDYQTALLECAEYGAGLNFSFMEADTVVLQDSAYSCYNAAGYERWKEQVIPMITRYQAEMAGLNSQAIVGHEHLTDSVTVTTYADGTKVYVNYATSDYDAGSVLVPARDYLVERGDK